MAPKELKVAFDGAVISVHVFVGGQEVALSSVGDDKWSCSEPRDIQGPETTAKLVFKAPAGTDYTLAITYGGKKIVDDEGESDAPEFSKPYRVELQ